MILMRESDGIHFLWNGDYPIRISPPGRQPKPWKSGETVDTSGWHHEYGLQPTQEQYLLNGIMDSHLRIFTIPQWGRYHVVARGQFKEV